MSPVPDDGSAELRLSAALAAWTGDDSAASRAEVYAALVDARVFAAISAARNTQAGGPGGPHRSAPTELALLTLVGSQGGRALPLFLDAGAAVAFRPGARPLALAGRDACSAALQDGAVAVLLDPPGAAFAVSGAVLTDLAAGRAPIAGSPLSSRRSTAPLHDQGDVPADPVLAGALAAALRDEPVRAARLLHGPHGPVLGLVPQHPLDAAGLAALAARVLPRLADALPPEGLDVTVVPVDGPGRPVPLERPTVGLRGLGRPGSRRRRSS